MLKDILKELRIDRNLTQKQLSEMLDLSKNTVCEYEKGRAEPSIETLLKLSGIFGVSVDYLLGREDDFGNITVTSSPSSDLSASSPNASLTPEERELLELYKKLPGTRKKTVLDTIRFMSDSSETSDKTRKEKYYGSK